MASSLCQIHVLYSTLTMSRFPLEIEKNIQARKISRFYSSAKPKIKEILDSSSHRINPLLWSVSRFWSSFIEIEVLFEEYSILHILYCYRPQCSYTFSGKNSRTFQGLSMTLLRNFKDFFVTIYLKPKNMFVLNDTCLA